MSLLKPCYFIGKGRDNSICYKKGGKENLKLIQPMITALKTNNLREIIKYEDIYVGGDINYTDYLTRTKESISLDLRAKEIKKKTEQNEAGKSD